MQEEYRRYQYIEHDLLTKIQIVERGLRLLSLQTQREQYQEQLEALQTLHSDIRALMLTAEELLTTEQLHRLQRRVNEHNPQRWQQYRNYVTPF